jgi:hypothetical protein
MGIADNTAEGHARIARNPTAPVCCTLLKCEAVPTNTKQQQRPKECKLTQKNYWGRKERRSTVYYCWW